jgi:hypothetical protein
MPDQNTGVCAARTNALVCNIHELITELEERIEDGEPFDNPKLTRPQNEYSAAVERKADTHRAMLTTP